MNLVEILLKLLGSGDMLNKISSLLGIDQGQAGKAVGAAIPTILAGLMGSAAKPEGASQLVNLLGKQSPGGLDDLGGLLSQGAEAGVGQTNPLSSLLGSAGLGQISGVLSKFTGVNEGGMGKLLGMLAPVVLGVLGKQSKGMDAAGLAGLLSSQKDNIASALPAGLGSLLGSAVPGIGNALSGAANAVQSTAAGAANAAAGAANAAAGAARQAEAAASPIKKFLIPLILLALAVLLVPRMCRKAPEAASNAASAVSGAVDAAADGGRFATDVSSLIKDATTAVGTIKDQATATSALPKLREINTQLGSLKALWAKLPAPAQKIASDTLRPLIASLRQAVQPVLAIPVVGPSIKPVVDEMLGALEGFAPAA
jgi:hypothetical protein